VGKYTPNLKIQIRCLKLAWINLDQHMRSYKKSVAHIQLQKFVI